MPKKVYKKCYRMPSTRHLQKKTPLFRVRSHYPMHFYIAVNLPLLPSLPCRINFSGYLNAVIFSGANRTDS